MELLLNYLKDLERNNNRDWFNQNKERYEEAKSKMLLITEIFLNEIPTFDPAIGQQNAKDCIFRIYRDVRFAKDKRPYKSHFGSEIAPGGKKNGKLGYYIHIQNNNSFIAGGLWAPEKEELKAVRTEIAENSEEFKSILNDPEFKKFFPDVVGQQLKVCPKGFDKNHPEINLLRYKTYTFIHPISNERILDGSFIEDGLDACEQLYKMNLLLRDIISDVRSEN